MEHSMEKKYFPVFIDLSEKKVTVIGGGTIACRRVKTLCEFTEHIRVVAPEAAEFIKQAAGEKKVEWIKDTYKQEYIEDADLLVAATDDPQVNHQVKADGMTLEKQKNRRILVSVADDRNLCDFYFPSIVQTEDVVVGINSGGSPKHTKEVRKKIEEILQGESIY